MGATGAYIARNTGKVKLEPLAGTITEWNNSIRSGNRDPEIEHAALYDANGEPIVGYQGDEDSVALDSRVLRVPGGTMTHNHPDDDFGGTLSMADLNVFARSQLKRIEAVSSQGSLYTITAGENVDRDGLRKWIRANQKLMQRNFSNSYKSALKKATTVIKSGVHEGKVKLTNPKTGKAIYRDPMTPEQAANYARQYSVGMFDRMYKKAFDKFGISYNSTNKAGI